MNYVITRASLDDIQGLYECECQVFAETDFMLLSQSETGNLLVTLQRRLHYIQASEKDQLWVAKQDGKIIGWLDATGSAFRKKQHAIYLVLAVRKQYWRQGIGGQLLESVIEWARNSSITRLELTVLETNKSAINLYKKYGFEQEGIKRKSVLINSHYQNELMMARFL